MQSTFEEAFDCFEEAFYGHEEEVEMMSEASYDEDDIFKDQL